jgi:imidazolonepropionase-like amidohydrolase
MRIRRWLAAGFGVLGALVLAAGLVAWLLTPTPAVVPHRLPVLLENVTIIEPGVGRAASRDIRIRDGEVVSTSPSAVRPSAGDDEAIVLSGGFVLPGLIDMHVHFPPSIAVGQADLWAALFLAHGVTTVRETGSIGGGIWSLRDRGRAGELPAPRIFTCGPPLDGDPPAFPTNRRIRGPVEARTAVRELAAAGADCIKVYNMLSREDLEAIRDEAHTLGLPLIGHVPHSVDLAESGLREVQHLMGIPRIDRATIGSMDYEIADWLAVDSKRIDWAVEVSLANHIAHTPTLVNSRQRMMLLDARERDLDSGLRHLPRFWDAVWATLWRPPVPPGQEQRVARWRAIMAEATRRLHAAGVPVYAGTDTLMPYVAPGSSLWGELHELVSAGFTPEEALAAATTVPGAALPRDGLGTVRAGGPADLLVFRGDPTRDLEALGTLEVVIADGRVYRSSDLQAMLTQLDRHFLSPFYTAVMGTVARIGRGYFGKPPEAGDPPAPRQGLQQPPSVHPSTLAEAVTSVL